MKKRIFALLVCFFMTLCSVNVYAAEPYDSVVLNKDEVESVKKHEYERIIKVYTIYFWHEVAEGKDIRQIVQDSSYESYLVYSYCNPVYVGRPDEKYFRDGNLCEITLSSRASARTGDFFKYAIYPEYVLGAKGHVLETYCIDALYEGLFIYYVTDNGDFILCREPGYTTGNFYLIPASEFSSIAQRVMDFYRENRGNVGFYTPREEDMSSYTIKPALFYLLISPVIWVCFIPVFVREKRRRKALKMNKLTANIYYKGN